MTESPKQEVSAQGLARVGIRDLRNNVAAIVRRAAGGERMVITSDGVPVAVLGPVTPAASGVTLDDLVAAGLVVPPGRHDHPDEPEPVPLPVDSRSARVLGNCGGSDRMTLFVDTSALVRRYVAEAGRELVVDAMAADEVWVASALARTEVMVCLHQLAAGPRQQARLWSAFRDDWDAFAVVPVDDRCLGRAVELGSAFALRTVDAVHLAAADRLPRPARYLTFDRHQIPAAAALGFEIVSPAA